MPSDISISNYFEKSLSWDLLVQGFFMINIIIVCFLLLLYMMPEYHVTNESFLDFLIKATKNKLYKFFENPAQNSRASLDNAPSSSSEAEKKPESDLIGRLSKIIQLFSLGTVVVILSFITGVIVSEVSDSFMDQNDYVHLGLKKNWVDDKENLINTDNNYKIQIFEKIFGKNALDSELVRKEIAAMSPDLGNPVSYQEAKKKIIKQIYYEGKNEVLAIDKWKDYLSYTQNLVNLNQTFCLSTWLLIIVSLLSLFTAYLGKEKIVEYRQARFLSVEFLSVSGFLLLLLANIFIPFEYSTLSLATLGCASLALLLLILFRKLKGFRTTTAVIFLIFSLLLYHVTAIAWHRCEEESDSKTFGLVVHLDEDLNKQYIKILKKSIQATQNR